VSEHGVNGLEKASLAGLEALREPHEAGANGARGRDALPLVAYLTPEQAGELLQIHPRTLRRWSAADPTLPVLHIAQTTRYPRERLLRWLRDREQGRPAGRQPSSKQMLSARNGAKSQGSG
jgi:hypothetical protein